MNCIKQIIFLLSNFKLPINILIFALSLGIVFFQKSVWENSPFFYSMVFILLFYSFMRSLSGVIEIGKSKWFCISDDDIRKACCCFCIFPHSNNNNSNSNNNGNNNDKKKSIKKYKKANITMI